MSKDFESRFFDLLMDRLDKLEERVDTSNSLALDVKATSWSV